MSFRLITFEMLIKQLVFHVKTIVWYVFLDDENALQSEKADSILTYARMCRREAACKEANFLANKTTHSLFDEGQQARKVERFVKRDGSFYIEKVFLEFCRFYRLM